MGWDGFGIAQLSPEIYSYEIQVHELAVNSLNGKPAWNSCEVIYSLHHLLCEYSCLLLPNY